MYTIVYIRFVFYLAISARLAERSGRTGVSAALVRRHGEHVLGDVDAQVLGQLQSHLVELLVVLRVVHQHLDLYVGSTNQIQASDTFDLCVRSG